MQSGFRYGKYYTASPLDDAAICALGCEQFHYVVSSSAPFFPPFATIDSAGGFI